MGLVVRARKTSSRDAPRIAKSRTVVRSGSRASSTRADVGGVRDGDAQGGPDRVDGEHPAPEPAHGVRVGGRVDEDDLQPPRRDAFLELRRCPLRDDAALVDDDDVVREPVGLVEVLGREDDGRPGRRERLDDLPQLLPAARVEPGRRLVEEHHGWHRDEAEREVEPPAHAAGERRDPAPAVVREVDEVEQLRGPGPGAAAGQPCEAGDDAEVLLRGEGVVDRRGLPREAEPAADLVPLADDVEARDPRRAGVRDEQGGEDADRRRLARAVRAEEGAHGAGRDDEVEAGERLVVAVGLAQAHGLDGRMVGHGAPSRPRRRRARYGVRGCTVYG